MSSNNRTPKYFVLAIVLFGIAFSIPIWLHTGEVVLGADIQHHVLWSENFAKQFWSGELYPRWLESENAGLGSPTFFFYAPLPFYVSALFHPLATISGIPWFAVAAAATLAMAASGLAAYAWLRSFATPRASLTAAIFYMATPFHLGADLYARFAYAEFWGFVWMPLVLLASRPGQAGASSAPSAIRTCVAVAIPYALLALTHLSTLLLFSAIPLLQAVALASPERRLGHVFRVFAGMVLGFAMAAVFVVPAWGDQGFISIHEINTLFLYGHYYHHFLIDSIGDPANAGVNWFERGLDLWICLVLAFTAYAVMFLFRQERKLDRDAWFWILVALGSVLVSTRVAEPAWRILPVFKIVQFPWRFGTVSTVSVTALSAMIVSRVHGKGSSTKALVSEYVGSWKSAALLLLSILAFSWIVFTYTSHLDQYPIPWFAVSIASLALLYCGLYGFAMPFDQSDRRSVLGAWLIGGFLVLANIPHVIPQIAWHWDTLRKHAHPHGPLADEMRAQLAASFDPKEYRIQTVSRENYSPENMTRLRETLQPVTLMTGSGTVSLVEHSPRHSTFKVDATTPVTIMLRRYFYPGTRFLSSSGQPLGKVTASAEQGLVLAELPAGSYSAEMVLTKGPNEKLGLWVSCISIALCLSLAAVARRQSPGRLATLFQ